MIEVKNLKKSFKDGESITEVLKGINFVVKSGEFIAIMGRSGAGKSTFLYQMSLLDEPTEGDIFIDKKNMNLLTVDEKTYFRLSQLGYVFQDYALLPEMNALENVALPLLMQDMSEEKAYKEATEALIKVGLEKRLHNLPSQLSGGEQQRVSIARAIAHEPQILFADEPTANLDNESSRIIMDIFKELHSGGQTIIMITHEVEYSKFAERIIHLDDGRITKDQSMKK
ncbi:ABC transporter [Candidatus Nomurabacteria bacterium RIFCSPHIGHO2_02_FULL_33_12]|nr:MAG: ABC transporter [Candidatus Nomurabacteria bacterium RIFCSPHIGHO2_02_FULL_33_12]